MAGYELTSLQPTSWHFSLFQSTKQPTLDGKMAPPKHSTSPAAARLCSIYARDILRFLPRREVEKLHLVSSAMAIVVGASKGRLPKHIFNELEITAVRSQGARCQLANRTHLTNTPLFQFTASARLGLVWRSAYSRLRDKPCTEFTHCCPEDIFHPLSERLVDQSFFLHRPPTEKVMLRVIPSGVPGDPTPNSYGMAWVGENRLNGDSAYDLLHLFHHLARDIVFKRMGVLLLHDVNGDWEVSPAVAVALKQPQFRIRAREMRAIIHRLSFPALESIRDLVDCQVIWVTAKERVEALRLVTEAAGIKKLHLIGMPVDVLVEVGAFGVFLCIHISALLPLQHLTTGVPNLRGAVPWVTSSRNRNWPVTCPRGGATRVGRVTKSGHTTLRHHYEKRNLHTGEKFTVIIYSNLEGERISQWASISFRQ